MTTTYRPATFAAAPTITVAKVANEFSGRREYTGTVTDISAKRINLTVRTGRGRRQAAVAVSIPMISAEIVA